MCMIKYHSLSSLITAVVIALLRMNGSNGDGHDALLASSSVRNRISGIGKVS